MDVFWAAARYKDVRRRISAYLHEDEGELEDVVETAQSWELWDWGSNHGFAVQHSGHLQQHLSELLFPPLNDPSSSGHVLASEGRLLLPTMARDFAKCKGYKMEAEERFTLIAKRRRVWGRVLSLSCTSLLRKMGQLGENLLVEEKAGWGWLGRDGGCSSEQLHQSG